MTEALKCLRQAREIAVRHRDVQAGRKMEAEAEAAEAAKEVTRMETRINEIDAAIKKLGGKQER